MGKQILASMIAGFGVLVIWKKWNEISSVDPETDASLTVSTETETAAELMA